MAEEGASRRAKEGSACGGTAGSGTGGSPEAGAGSIRGQLSSGRISSGTEAQAQNTKEKPQRTETQKLFFAEVRPLFTLYSSSLKSMQVRLLFRGKSPRTVVSQSKNPWARKGLVVILHSQNYCSPMHPGL
jgi:hypothetical protein